MTLKKIPLRTCVGCGEKKPKKELISIIKSPKNEKDTFFEVFEKNIKKDGRSAYICKNTECLQKAIKYRKLEKSFKCKIDKKIYESLENIMINKKSETKPIGHKTIETEEVPKSKDLINFLGITKKSGNVVLGMDNVKKGVLEKNIKLILVTKDISNNSFEEIKNLAILSNTRLFKISFSKDDIFNLFGKYSAIIGIKNENFIRKITDIIDSELYNPKNDKCNREECSI